MSDCDNFMSTSFGNSNGGSNRWERRLLLTDAIRHAVFPIVFELGAFAERIEMHCYGEVIPFDTNSELIYKSVVRVLSGENYRNASVADIKSGKTYDCFLGDYLRLESTDQLLSVA